ncbi:MAG: YCF48-related protein [Deltaproteobacteria bacterium]|nr:YCF48-related protein [Deltaproteobacteria bacterium]
MFSVRNIAISRVSQFLAMLCLWLPVAAIAQVTSREPAFRDNFYDVVALGREAWIVGYYGTILHSGDGAVTWTLQNSQTREALYRIAFAEKNTGWVSGSYGTLLHTRDSGKSWQKQTTNTEEHLFGLHFLDSMSGWAVGSRGVILRTENGGVTWTNASIGEDVILNDVRFVNPKQGWAVGEFGRIYQTRDGGRSWEKQQSPIEVSLISGESRNLFRLLFSNGNAGWAFGLDGAILKTQGGGRWDLASPDGAVPPLMKRHHLFSASFYDGTTFAVGERGTVLVFRAENNQWAPAGLKIPPVTLNGIAFGADGLGLIVGNRGLILRSQNGGNGWEQIRIEAQGQGKGVSQNR